MINVNLIEESALDVRLENDSEISVDVSEITNDEGYDGAYEAIPKINEQNFPTKGKTMTKDFKVKGIPSYEVDNPQGGVTFIIGGN